MSGPWEKYAPAAQSGPWNKYAPRQPPVTVKGTLQAFGSGALGGFAGLGASLTPGSPEGTGNLMQMGGRLVGMFNSGAGAKIEAARQRAGLHTTEEDQAALHLLHNPENSTERFAGEAGQMLPNAIGPGGPLRAVARVVAPVVAGNAFDAAAGALGANRTGRTIAHIAGSVVGGAATGGGERVPASVTSLTPVERGAVSRFAKVAKPDVNAMTGQSAAYRAAGIDPTLTDVVGNSGRRVIRSTSSRLGPASDQVQSFAEGRSVNLPGRLAAQAETARPAVPAPNLPDAAPVGDRILDAVHQVTGVAPDAAKGDIAAVVANGQAEAKPLYDAVRARGDPVWNPTLETLATRPNVKAAIAQAIKNAQGVEDPHAMGLTFMDNPNNWATAGKDGESLISRSGPSRAPPQGPSLLKHIADNGGIKDEGGEISNMDGDKWHVGKAFQRPLIGNKDGVDGWRVRAHEAGYFQGEEPPSSDEFYDAIASNLRGNKTYARGADPGAADRFANRNAMDEQAYRDPNGPSPEQYTGSSEPVPEPVPMAQPTAKTWLAVKQALGNSVERDQFGRVLSERQSPNNTVVNRDSRDLKDALHAAVPGMADADGVAGDYLSASSAYDRARGTLFGANKDPRDFAAYFRSLKPGEQQAARASIANDIFTKANNGQLRASHFDAPAVQQKLSTAFGQDGAQGIIQHVGAIAEDAARASPQDVGGGILSAKPDVHANAMTGMSSPERLAAQHSAVDAIQTQALKGPSTAPGLARQVALNDNTGANLTQTFGGDTTADLQNRFGLENMAVRNATDIAPRTGSWTANNASDNAVTAGNVAQGAAAAGSLLTHGNPAPAVLFGLKLGLKNNGFNEAQADALARLSIDPGRLGDVIDYIHSRAGPGAAQQFLSAVRGAPQNAISAATSPQALIPGAIAASNAFSPYAQGATAQ